MAKEIFSETQKLMQGMGGNPRNSLKISRQALKLLEQLPKGGKTCEEVERNLPLNNEAVRIARDLKESAAGATARLYKKPKQYGEGLKVVNEIDQFIRSREPSFESIH